MSPARRPSASLSSADCEVRELELGRREERDRRAASTAFVLELADDLDRRRLPELELVVAGRRRCVGCRRDDRRLERDDRLVAVATGPSPRGSRRGGPGRPWIELAFDGLNLVKHVQSASTTVWSSFTPALAITPTDSAANFTSSSVLPISKSLERLRERGLRPRVVHVGEELHEVLARLVVEPAGRVRLGERVDDDVEQLLDLRACALLLRSSWRLRRTAPRRLMAAGALRRVVETSSPRSSGRSRRRSRRASRWRRARARRRRRERARRSSRRADPKTRASTTDSRGPQWRMRRCFCRARTCRGRRSSAVSR